MADVIALLGTDYFIQGLTTGAVAVLLIWAIRLSWKSLRRPLPVVGPVIALATVVTIERVEDSVDPAIYPALAVILVAVSVAAFLKTPLWVQLVAAVPGAIWLALGTTATEWTWGRILIASLVPVGGAFITDFERRHEGLGLGVIGFALAALGVFGAVPDTEWAVTLLAVTSILVFSAWPKVGASLGPAGAYMAVAVLVWVALDGGEARPASVVGSVACLGVLLVEPILTYFKPSFVGVSKWVRQNWVGAVVASLPQFMMVLICSRIAARFTDALPALAIVTFAYVGAFLIGWRMADSREGVEFDDA